MSGSSQHSGSSSSHATSSSSTKHSGTKSSSHTVEDTTASASPPAAANPSDGGVMSVSSASRLTTSATQPRTTDQPPNVDDDIRRTREYRAAWDVELWKALQAERFRVLLEQKKQKAFADLRSALKAKERVALGAIEQREKEVTNNERRIREEFKLIDTKKVRLVDLERELRALRHKLTEENKRAMEESNAHAQRALEEAVHKNAMMQQRLEFAEEQTRRAEERMRRAQQDYLTLYEEFNAHKTRQLTQASEQSAQVEARLRSQIVLETVTHQERSEMSHRDELRKAQDRSEQLERENSRLSAALAARREQVRLSLEDAKRNEQALQKLEEQNRQLREVLVRNGARPVEVQGMVAASPIPSREPPATRDGCGDETRSLDGPSIRSEISRLKRERHHLLDAGGGAYTSESMIVSELDKRIAQLQYATLKAMA